MLDLSLFFFDAGQPTLLVFGEHNPWMVLLSVLIAIFTSAMALQLAGVARLSSSRLYRQVAIATGAIALGGGVWAMHFIGMLAFQLCAAVSYDPAVTVLSALPSFFASWVALNLLARSQVSAAQFIGGGVLVGAGIGAMHYSGMAGMQMAPLLRYDPWMFGLSILVAVVLAIIALWVRFGLRRWVQGWVAILLSGVVMGLAIAGMHYTGMAAARFVGVEEFAVPQGVRGSFYLALAVAMATISLSVFVAAANGLLRYRHLFRELEAGRNHLSSLLDAAFEAIFTIDHQGMVRSVNHAVFELFGWQPEELIGQHMSLLLPPEYAREFGDALEQYMRTGEPRLSGSELELMGLARDGREIPVRLSLGVTHRDGKPWFVVFVADIGERKAMEAALRDSEQQYRSLIRNIPGVSFRCLLNDDWTTLFISDAVKRLTGWPAEEFINGRSFTALYHPDDLERVIDEVYAAVAKGRSYVIEYRLFDRDGREHWVWESGSAEYDQSGEPRWIDGVLLDQTETKLRNAEYEGKVTAISKAMAMIEFDLQGRVLEANENFLDLFGYGREELIGQYHALFCDEALVHSERYRSFWADLRQGVFRSGEYRRIGKDGRDVWIQATYNPILDADGRPFKVVKLATDLTPRRLMEQDLRNARDRAEQAAAARSSFLANMSHEIRTPMNAIIGFSELLLDTPLSESQRRHLRTVQHSSRSLLGLLNDILDTAKLDRGAIELEHLDFSLRELCEQVCAAQRLGAEKKGLALHLEYAAHLGDFFKGDPLRLQQVITNLLGNAVKFTERGEVRLVVDGAPGALRVAIHDTGIGIAEDRLEKIFDPFAQADASMSRRFGGTGLGTTISRQLVELMGGHIRVQSREGEGSVFTVELPLSRGTHVRQSERSAVPVLARLRILAADDVAQNLELLELNLQRLGHEVHSVNDGRAAVDAYAAQPFDLVLMDVQMPGMDGLEATHLIREFEQREQRPAVPIIALTASVLDRDRQNALDAGMNGFASKPLDVPELVAEMARLLEGRQLATALDTAPMEREAAALFDWNRGKELWGGPVQMAAAIGRFLSEQDDLLSQLRSALERHALDDVAAMAHRLRGAAANLGLSQMAGCAGDLERGGLAGKLADLEPLLHALERVLDTVREALPLFPTDSETSAGAGAELYRAGLLQAGQALAQELARGGLDDAALEVLQRGLEGRPGHARLQDLQRALDDFDFDQALEHLHGLLGWLETGE
ncbi:PAS domain S-box protein [Pseudomonas sp. TUM22785]|uniref:PAS domain S-box protein n=1 Tax=Pseudomonas sp. TUM22785 TaxID=3019098 RepID=UPI00230547C3|nr:PAS domain S-box protein [Pseudomonas sp. TUM22785]WCD78412.1 PAS domain S-box protein [Pseudomonas sp. TUM22785]